MISFSSRAQSDCSLSRWLQKVSIKEDETKVYRLNFPGNKPVSENVVPVFRRAIPRDRENIAFYRILKLLGVYCSFFSSEEFKI